MVQESATLAYRMRGPDQRAEAAAWTQSLPLSRRGRNEAMGGVGRSRRYPNQHGQHTGGQSMTERLPCGSVVPSPVSESQKVRHDQPAKSESPILRRKVATNRIGRCSTIRVVD